MSGEDEAGAGSDRMTMTLNEQGRRVTLNVMTTLKGIGSTLCCALLLSWALEAAHAQRDGTVFFYVPAEDVELTQEEPLPEPLTQTFTSVNDIYRRLNDLDGKIVCIQYKPLQPHPVDDNRYADDLLGYPRSIYVEFPADKVRERFDREDLPSFRLYCLVYATRVRDQYGHVSRGPVLVAVGTTRHVPLGGPATYQWQ